MPSTKNSNKSLKIRLCKKGDFFRSTNMALKGVHSHCIGAFFALG
jgi:hypothetical protein